MYTSVQLIGLSPYSIKTKAYFPLFQEHNEAEIARNLTFFYGFQVKECEEDRPDIVNTEAG